jgi:hypothetical protein
MGAVNDLLGRRGGKWRLCALVQHKDHRKDSFIHSFKEECIVFEDEAKRRGIERRNLWLHKETDSYFF